MVDLDAIGTFRWSPSGDHWHWDDALFRLLGYEPGVVVPSRELLLGHAHPSDRDGVADAVSALMRHRTPYRTRHRIVTTSGRTREVAALGGPVRVPAGDTAVLGYLIGLDEDRGAPSLTGPLLPAAGAEVVIPLPRGRDGAGPAEPVSPADCAGGAVVPEGRPAEEADAHHAAALHRAQETLVAGLELSHDAAAAVVAWLANRHEVPPVVIAESLAALPRDDHGRPELATLLALLEGGPDAGPVP